MDLPPPYSDVPQDPPPYRRSHVRVHTCQNIRTSASFRVVLKCGIQDLNGFQRLTLSTHTGITLAELITLIRRRVSVALDIRLLSPPTKDILWLRNTNSSQCFLLDDDLWSQAKIIFSSASDWEILLHGDAAKYEIGQNRSFQHKLSHFFDFIAVHWHERTTTLP